MPRVSIVIPAYNEAASLPRTLAQLRTALAALELDAEIVVADDGSTDDTAAIAAAAGARVVSVAHRQISRTRNSGAAAARGDRLIFVDADTLVPARTLAQALLALDRGAVGGGAIVAFDEPLPGPAAALFALFVPLYFHVGRYAAGAFVFARRDAFEAVGGFDDRIYAGEEVQLTRRLRTQGRIEIVETPVVTSARKFRTHSFWFILWTMLRLAPTALFGGPRSRRGADLWYDGRRA